MATGIEFVLGLQQPRLFFLSTESTRVAKFGFGFSTGSEPKPVRSQRRYPGSDHEFYFKLVLVRGASSIGPDKKMLTPIRALLPATHRTPLPGEILKTMDHFPRRSANSTPLTPLTFLDRAATVYGDCTSIVYGNTTFTWTQTLQRCLQAASSIVNLGIKPLQVVSVIAPNIPAMYELYFAIPFAGAVINSINTRLDPRTVSVIIAHSESKLVFVDYQSASVVTAAVSMFSPDTPKPMLVVITKDGNPSECHRSDGFLCSYESMVQKGDPGFDWIRPESEWDPIALNYTSGTTSAPKGVVHSHRGMFVMAVDSLIEWAVPKQAVYLWTLPMFHANGWSYTWGTAAVGAVNVCLRRFDGADIYDSINRHGVTHMCAAPVVLNMLWNSTSDVRVLKNRVEIMTAGAPPPAPVLARAESIGFNISHGYGLTETGGLVVTCAWKEKWNRLPATERARLKARQGVRTIGFTDMDVVNPESGLSVTRDGLTLGEVVLRGASVMLGYFKDPEETAKSMRENGWFYTGDVAVMHPDGYLEIKDRSKDVIISGGENLSSVEVESILYTHSAVNEAAVVARQDEFWGETPCAFVSLKTEMMGNVTEKELVEYCRGKLAGYMVPKTVVFMSELPKTSTGKIQKFVLREKAKAMGPSSRSRM